MSGEGDAQGFRDRLTERETLAQLLRDARDGRSAVLVVRGEAGVGKSALLRAVARRASGFRVAQIAGVESEMELPFAALHQLCSPMLTRIDGLPPPQERALCVALGPCVRGCARPLPCRARRPDPARRGGGGGAVALLRRRRPVARRRLPPGPRVRRPTPPGRARGDRVRVREPSADPELVGLPELLLGGLDDEDARALLATVIPGRSTSASGTGSSRRHEAIRLRSSSFRGGSGGAWPADSGSLTCYRSRAGSRRASCGGCRICRVTRASCCWSRRLSPSATPR